MWLKVFEFIKKYAWIMLIVVLVVGGIGALNSKFQWIKFSKTMDSVVTHEKELTAGEIKIAEEEKAKNQESFSEYIARTEKENLGYTEAIDKLNKEKEKREKELCDKDPSGLAEDLSKTFGVTYVP